MKFNWGGGILAFIITFLIAVVAFIIYTSQQEYQLVEEDYYPKELKYGEKIQMMENANSLGDNIKIIKTGEKITITFPSITKGKTPQGRIHIYRPSDEKKDFIVPIEVGPDGTQEIGTNNMIPGKYIFKIEWLLDGVSYYQEETFIF
jgi:hypothetical protein